MSHSINWLTLENTISQIEAERVFMCLILLLDSLASTQELILV